MILSFFWPPFFISWNWVYSPISSKKSWDISVSGSRLESYEESFIKHLSLSFPLHSSREKSLVNLPPSFYDGRKSADLFLYKFSVNIITFTLDSLTFFNGYDKCVFITWHYEHLLDAEYVFGLGHHAVHKVDFLELLLFLIFDRILLLSTDGLLARNLLIKTFIILWNYAIFWR